MPFARILGTGHYLPKNVVTNHDLAARVDTSHDWIVQRTGIHQRHISEDKSSSELALYAAKEAIKVAGIQTNDIDLIVVGTSTPDLVFPSTACLLQQKLGITNGGGAFDVNAACSGFIFALSTADQFIRAGSAKRVLVVGSETMSRLMNWEDRGTCVLFGDGAAALVLEASEEPGILSTKLNSDGRYDHLLNVSGGVSKPPSELGADAAYLTMKGSEVFRFAVNTLGKIVEETLQQNDMQASDIDWLVPHQANIRIIEATAKKLNMPMEQVIVTVDKHANTSSASIPLALDQGIRDGRIKRGDVLLLEAFGGGFTWGSALIRY